MTTTETKTITCEDADRLLGLADQFLGDWEENDGKDDPECMERRAEWNAIRPLLVAAPSLLSGYQDMAELVEAYLVHKDVSDTAFVAELKAHLRLIAQIGGAASTYSLSPASRQPSENTRATKFTTKVSASPSPAHKTPLKSPRRR
jgi:hypothetical protein